MDNRHENTKDIMEENFGVKDIDKETENLNKDNEKERSLNDENQDFSKNFSPQTGECSEQVFSNENKDGKETYKEIKNVYKKTNYSESVDVSGKKKSFGFIKYIAVLIALAVLGASIGFGYKYAGTFFAEKKIELKTSDVQRAENISLDDRALSNAVSDIAAKYNPAVVSMVSEVPTYSGSQDRVIGTGVVFSEDNEYLYIVSNQHVVYDVSGVGVYERETPIKVSFDGEDDAIDAEVLGSDSLADLAVVKVEKKNINKDFLKKLKPVTFANSDNVNVGEWVVAIGNPLGYVDTTTFGIVSGLDRKVGDHPANSFGTYVNLIQIDAAINSGNSGGATFNLNGELIGINTIKIKETGVEGLGFAIASNDVKYVASQILEKGTVERAFLGISGRNVGLTPGNEFGVEKGVHVIEIIEKTGAQENGLKVDDVIIAVDSEKVETMEKLSDIIKTKKIGDIVKIEVIRRGVEKVDLKIKLGKRPEHN